jgi:purine-binding chemotaxis protein CheW
MLDPSKDGIQIEGDEELQLSVEQVRAILAERAAKLARVFAPPVAHGGDRRQLVAFSRGGRRYAVDLSNVAEVKPLDHWTRVPGVPPFYLGVIQLRGDIVALVDLPRLFGDEPPAPVEEPFAVVFAARGVMLAVLADSIDDVHDLDPERVHPPLATFSKSRGRYISGLVSDGPAIIDAEKLLGDERLWVDHGQRA